MLASVTTGPASASRVAFFCWRGMAWPPLSGGSFFLRLRRGLMYRGQPRPLYPAAKGAVRAAPLESCAPMGAKLSGHPFRLAPSAHTGRWFVGRPPNSSPPLEPPFILGGSRRKLDGVRTGTARRRDGGVWWRLFMGGGRCVSLNSDPRCEGVCGGDPPLHLLGRG